MLPKTLKTIGKESKYIDKYNGDFMYVASFKNFDYRRAIIKTGETTANKRLTPNKNGISYNLKSIRKF